MLEDRYLVFGGEDYYPMGGWTDFIDCYFSLEEAKKVAKSFVKGRRKWAQIVEMNRYGDFSIVAEDSSQ